MAAHKRIGALGTIGLACWISATIAAQGAGEVAGAGAASLPAGTTLNLVSVRALQFGFGAAIGPDGLGAGDLHVTLAGTSTLGEPQQIRFDGKVTRIAIVQGVATLSGTGIQDAGDGGAPLVGVPFTVTATGSTLLLVLGTATLPQVALAQGAIAIR